ncbi:N-acetylmuramoyl-L-alanine amidase [Enterococcus casseliflavus]|jgi:N-acetylmuramoyl-L-alanine amidase|uniref:N-acetylmuramoyl-L-alanine amidase n=1 Tax=Enterococcus casseliflavus TaxID=37734 RepID=UPI0028F452C0|nr:N-acetylmuramoyl-L-alanine amidase [Enterococcus casseliflavus]
MVKIEKQIRPNTPQVGVTPYGQIHAHSTGNPTSTAQNEADYHMRRPIESGFFSHVVGNGRVIQTAPVNRGAYDVGGGWNAWGYAQVELIESHKTQAEFEEDYKIYVELLRSLAKEAGLPLKLDSGNMGILTHEYCTYNQPNNKSDHVDPYPYLKKRGISRAQFKKDIENGFETGGTSEVAKKVTYQTKTGWYEVIKADTFYCEPELKTKSGWNAAVGQRIAVDEVVKIKGKDGTVYTRGKTRLGSVIRYITLRDDTLKKV